MRTQGRGMKPSEKQPTKIEEELLGGLAGQRGYGSMTRQSKAQNEKATEKTGYKNPSKVMKVQGRLITWENPRAVTKLGQHQESSLSLAT